MRLRHCYEASRILKLEMSSAQAGKQETEDSYSFDLHSQIFSLETIIRSSIHPIKFGCKDQLGRTSFARASLRNSEDSFKGRQRVNHISINRHRCSINVTNIGSIAKITLQRAPRNPTVQTGHSNCSCNGRSQTHHP